MGIIIRLIILSVICTVGVSYAAKLYDGTPDTEQSNHIRSTADQ